MAEAYTVAQITTYIRNMFTSDHLLNNVTVKGEISNCKYHQTGHIYFTLKDDKSQISAVMFASDRSNGLKFKLVDGASVEIEGRIDVFERNGNYQLYAKRIRQTGDGELYERFLALKNELEERGMFAPEYKRPIPRFIKKLGVVTAPTGAAVRDIIQIAHRRNPWVQIILCPALVQGDGAAPSIVEGIHKLEALGVDTIIVGRGGGSIEDLWAFNEEIVAQAIFDSEIPIISAVGHETDFTIADFVADVRAATPSAGAEIAVFEAERMVDMLDRMRSALDDGMYQKLTQALNRAENLKLRLDRLSPANQIIQKKSISASLEDKLSARMDLIMKNKKHHMQLLITQMKGLSPLDKLNQGYSVATGSEGRRLHSVSDSKVGDNIRIYVSDGYIGARVEEIHEQ